MAEQVATPRQIAALDEMYDLYCFHYWSEGMSGAARLVAFNEFAHKLFPEWSATKSWDYHDHLKRGEEVYKQKQLEEARAKVRELEQRG